MFSDELRHDLCLFSFMIVYILFGPSDGAFVMQLVSLSFYYFCLTSLILLKQLFLLPSWAMSL